MPRLAQAPEEQTKQARKRAQQWFKDNGIAVATWAKEHGFKRQSVVDVLHGRVQCTRGAAHRIAVELGIKPEPKPITLKRAA
jgi:gp16 family phage-associated protein